MRARQARWLQLKRRADAEGDGEADVFKGAAITQVEFLPTPTMEAAPGPAKDATVGDEGVVNGTSATVVSDPHLRLPQRTMVARPWTRRARNDHRAPRVKVSRAI
jgi:hypothetical protein